jgi:bacterioferritin-associated ferredoxin
MIVCICKRTRSEEIEQAIDRGASSVNEVSMACGGAGTGCGRCRPYIHDRLEQRGVGCESSGKACPDCPSREQPLAATACAATG